MRDESAIEFVHSQEPKTTRAAGADIPGIEQLLRRYDGLISLIAASYEFHPARAQDLTQEILIAVWRAWPSFRGECSERTFVARIAHYQAITHVDLLNWSWPPIFLLHIRWQRRSSWKTKCSSGSELHSSACPSHIVRWLLCCSKVLRRPRWRTASVSAPTRLPYEARAHEQCFGI